MQGHQLVRAVAETYEYRLLRRNLLECQGDVQPGFLKLRWVHEVNRQSVVVVCSC